MFALSEMFGGFSSSAAARCNQQELMLSAITAGNLELVEELVSHGMMVNGDYRTPLCMAVKEGQTEIAEFLLCNGADVNGTGVMYDEPPLIHAVRDCNPAMINLLLNSGAYINGGADEGQGRGVATKLVHTTPMHVAATKDDIEILNLLLSCNADVNLRNTQLETPLHLAANSGHPANVHRLLVCGASHDTMDKQGYTPMHHAVSRGHITCIRELAKLGSSVNLPTSSSATPLMLAVTKHQLGALKTLLHFEPDLNRTDGLLLRNVAHAVIDSCPHRTRKRNVISINQEIEMMESLVQAGVDINCADKNLNTPLHNCVRVGCSALLEYLVKCKHIIPNAVNQHGETPMMLACIFADNNQIKILATYCPDLLQNPHHLLLEKLATKSNLAAMRFLLDAGYRYTRTEVETIREKYEDNVDEEIVKFVDGELLQPWSLQRACRTVVRLNLHSQLHSKIYRLQVPQKLRDIIILEDIFLPT